MKHNGLVAVITWFMVFGFTLCAPPQLTYEQARQAVLAAERKLMIGGSVLLSPKEIAVNKILLEAKRAEIEKGQEDLSRFPPATHFFKVKPIIEASNVFKIIKKMPKGALLHAHNSAMVSSEWFIKNITYRSGIMKCVNRNGVVLFTFRRNPQLGCKTFIYIQDERASVPDVETYDKELEKNINLYTPTPEVDYPDIGVVWNKFQNMFDTVGDALLYKPVFEAYHYQLFKEMHDDGVIYIELRTSFPSLYDYTNNKTISAASVLLDVIDNFKANNPNFYGVKIIFSTGRNSPPATIAERFQTFKYFFAKYPKLVIGFDLVGQEDLGHPLFDFVEELQNRPPDSHFFFHAGETNQFGSTDLNILDAVLLNTTRIGHGYSLFKHPVVWHAAKKRGIAVEINPLSNQVLKLVWDLRNHPAVFYISQNFPVVISNDDPGFWNAKGVSYDYYYAFMSFFPNEAGLNVLKQLAWNTLKYSSLKDNEKLQVTRIFERMWEKFLNDILAGTFQ